MLRKFKKPNGFIVKTDSNVHSEEYIKNCAKMFDEIKETSSKKYTKKK